HNGLNFSKSKRLMTPSLPSEALSLSQRESVTRSSFANRQLSLFRSPCEKSRCCRSQTCAPFAFQSSRVQCTKGFVSENSLAALHCGEKEFTTARVSGCAPDQTAKAKIWICQLIC